MKTLISVIVPVYNVAEFLPRTINSILAQTYKNFELILVDDGSPDNSGQICDKYAAKDNRIRVYHTPNAGAGAARIYGVRKAIGHWIMFVDGDDTISENCIEGLLSIDNKAYDIISGTINNNNVNVFHHVKVGEITNEEYISLLLESKTFTGPVAKLIRKECLVRLKPIPKHITNNEDMLMLVSIATQCKKIYLDNNIVCYNYLHRDTSASKSVTMPLDAWLELFNIIKNELSRLNNNSISISFIKYRLKRLYLCCMLKGVYVGLENSYIANLYKECRECKDLDSYDQKIVHLIFNKKTQIIDSLRYRLIKRIKCIVKKMLVLKR